MRYPVPIFTSLFNFVFPFDIFILSRQKRYINGQEHRFWDKTFVALSILRYASSLVAVLLFVYSERHWRSGLVLLIISLSLHYTLCVYISKIYPSASTIQESYLFLNLALSPINFLFDIGGKPEPLQHAAHFILVFAAVAFGALVHTILTPLHKAYGCYPASTSWYDLDKGLCPQFFGDPNDQSRSPICRENDLGILCSTLRPPHVVYRHVFMIIASSAVLLYLAALPAKMFRMVL